MSFLDSFLNAAKNVVASDAGAANNAANNEKLGEVIKDTAKNVLQSGDAGQANVAPSQAPQQQSVQPNVPTYNRGSLAADTNSVYPEVGLPDLGGQEEQSGISPEMLSTGNTDNFLPTVQRNIDADKAAYNQYMEYYNNRDANEEEYVDNALNPLDQIPEALAFSLGAGGGENIVDNGQNDFNHRISNFITGAEAKKQANYFGNSELAEALKDVDDGEILQKSYLEKYGYRPFTYTEDPVSYSANILDRGLTNLASESERFWNGLGDLRNQMAEDENLGWKVKYKGDTLNGKAVDDAILASMQNPVRYDLNGNNLLEAVNLENHAGHRLADGSVEVSDDRGVVYRFFQDAPIEYTFEPAVVEMNGKRIEIPVEDWIKVTRNPEIGQILTAQQTFGQDKIFQEKEDDYNKLHEQMGSGSGDVSLDYGLLGMSAPGYDSQEFIGGRAPLASLSNAFLQSAAYLNPYTLVERGALSGALGANGVNVRSQNVGDNGIVSYTPAVDTFTNDVVGTLAPIAESKLGSLGNVPGAGGIFERPIRKLTDKIPGLDTSFVGREILPKAFSEGMEEVVTEPLYNLQENGLPDWFATQAHQRSDGSVTQSSGDYYDAPLAYDEYGRPVYEKTPVGERVLNFLDSVPDNFALGAAMGGGMHAIPRINQYRTKEGREAIQEEKAINKQNRDYYSQYSKEVGKEDRLDRKDFYSMLNKARMQFAMQGKEPILSYNDYERIKAQATNALDNEGENNGRR